MREMIGLAKGFVCDGELSDAEAAALRQWLVGNSAIMDTMPASKLGDRLLKAFEDGTLDDGERRELTTIPLSISKST